MFAQYVRSWKKGFSNIEHDHGLKAMLFEFKVLNIGLSVNAMFQCLCSKFYVDCFPIPNRNGPLTIKKRNFFWKSLWPIQQVAAARNDPRSFQKVNCSDHCASCFQHFRPFNFGIQLIFFVLCFHQNDSINVFPFLSINGLLLNGRSPMAIVRW